MCTGTITLKNGFERGSFSLAIGCNCNSFTNTIAYNGRQHGIDLLLSQRSVLKELKVIHLSSSLYGGAGIAAQRLNQSLIGLGINSKLLTLSPVCGEAQIQIRRNISQLFLGKLNSLFAGLISNRTFFSIFSKDSLSIRRIRKYLSPEEGVIHIHNWFNLISEATIFRLIKEGYKVVLTLHDERLLTGGCHYSLNCRQFERACQSCPEIPKKLQMLPNYVFSKNLTEISNLDQPLELIAPSNWIAGEAHRSTLLRKANIHVIQNSLHHFGSTIDYEIRPKNMIGKSGVIRLGVASKDPSAYIKCGDLIETLHQDNEFNAHYRLILMADYLDEDRDLFWEDIDLLLVASRIDNSPNVIHEAKSLGIPVIGTNVGGIPELLTSTDFLIELSDLSKEFLLSLKTKLIATLQNKVEIIKERDNFKQWSIESAALHIELYKRLVN